jgi:hypothetical protein
MTTKRERAWIGNEEEFQICHYTLEFRNMKRTELAEKIQSEVRWPGKPPEIEVLERKISRYRKQAIDYPEDEPWSMATTDKYPIPPQAIPAVLACWKRCVQNNMTLNIREAKWISRLYGLMAEEIRRDFTWRHGIKWLETETWCDNAIGMESSVSQSRRCNKEAMSELSLRVGEGDAGTIECPECRAPMYIDPTSRTTICGACDAQFNIARIPIGNEESNAVRKETLVVKNIPPIIKDINSLIYRAKGYAHLELIYDLIGQPFDSAYMDKVLMGLSDVMMVDLDDVASPLPYLALGIEDFKQFRDKIGRLTNERAHNKER